MSNKSSSAASPLQSPAPKSAGTTAKITATRRLSLLKVNKKSKRPVGDDEELFSRLDSSLKKNTAFVKRLKNVSADNWEAIADEFASLKLTKYVTEAASSLVECRPRNVGDILAIMEVTSLFNQRYPDFANLFLTAFTKDLSIEEPAITSEDYSSWINRQRQLLRLLCEFNLIGIITDTRMVLDHLTRLLPSDDEKGPVAIPVAISFLKSVGIYYCLLGSASLEEDALLQLGEEWRSKFHSLILSFYKSMCRLLVRTHSKLRTLEYKGRRFYETKGDLSTSQATTLKSTADFFDTLKNNLQSLSELISLPLPTLEDIAVPEMVEGKITFADLRLSQKADSSNGIYDSEEDRSFYEDIDCNLNERVPEQFLTGGHSNITTAKGISGKTRFVDDCDEDEDNFFGVDDVDPDSVEKGKPNDALTGDDLKSANKISEYFDKLPSMQNRALVEQMAIEFCYINSKAMRKRLAETLLRLPYRRLDLLPFIGRLLAILKPVFPDIIEAVNRSLVGQFFFLFHRKNPLLGTRSQVCRFISELTKFRVFPQSTAFGLLKRIVVDDLTSPNIEMLAILLESSGRFLFNQPESHRRLANLFEVINKKKVATGLDISHIVMLDNAMYAANPPSATMIKKEKKDPLLAYLYKLLHNDLNAGNAGEIFKKIRKYPWKKDEVENYLIKGFMKIWRVQYSNISLVASMMGTLNRLYSHFSVHVIDGLFEYFHDYLSNPQPKFNYRLQTIVRYLGELYCYNVIQSDVLMQLLHFLIVFGHPSIPRRPHPSPIDLPSNHLRIRLVCTVLQSCTTLLTDDPSLEKQFIQFEKLFTYYISTKVTLTSEVDFLIDDTFEALNRARPRKDFVDAAMDLLASSKGQLTFLMDDINADPLNIESESNYLEELPSFQSMLPTPKENDFDKAFTGMMIESVEERKLQKRAGPLDLSLPLGLISPTSSPTSSSNRHSTSLRLLCKKKNKATTKSIDVDPTKLAFLEAARLQREKFLEESRILQQIVLESQNDAPSAFGVALKSPEESVVSKKGGKTTYKLFGSNSRSR